MTTGVVGYFVNRLGSLSMAAGILLLLFYPCLWMYGKVSQMVLHREWETRIRSHTPSGEAAPTSVGRLFIPDIWVDQIVVEGIGEAQLAVGPGHFPHTALPGQGNCVIAGHLNINGSPFKDLQKLRPGQRVLLETDDHLYRFQVTGARIISPDDTDVLDQTTQKKLTLITCMPGARMRYLVACKQVGID